MSSVIIEDSAKTVVYSVKCMKCGLHFNVYTWYPDKHSRMSMHCPECGQNDGKFILWKSEIDEPIFTQVPYNSDSTHIVDIAVG